MEEKTTKWDRDSRDLLIEVYTEMKSMRSDINKMSDGISSRLALVEREKLDRTEANRLQSEYLTNQTSQESRLRELEDEHTVTKSLVKTWLAIGGTALALLQVVVQVAISFVFPSH